MDIGSDMDSILKQKRIIDKRMGENISKKQLILNALNYYFEHEDPLFWNEVQKVREEAINQKKEEKQRIMEILHNDFVNEIKEGVSLAADEGNENKGEPGKGKSRK
jgi:hypothetical protein